MIPRHYIYREIYKSCNDGRENKEVVYIDIFYVSSKLLGGQIKSMKGITVGFNLV